MELEDECFRKTALDSQKAILNYLNNASVKSNEKEDFSTNLTTNKKGNTTEMDRNTKNNLNNGEFSYMKNFQEEDDNFEIPKKRKTKERYVLTEDKAKVHYIGIFFQGFIKEYFGQINRSIKNKFKYSVKTKNNEERIKNEDLKRQLYLELLIYYSYNLFVKHCEKVVIKIINDLSTFKTENDILKSGKLHPIVFPNPFYLTHPADLLRRNGAHPSARDTVTNHPPDAPALLYNNIHYSAHHCPDLRYRSGPHKSGT